MCINVGHWTEIFIVDGAAVDHLRFLPNGLGMKQCQNIAEAWICKASKLCWFQNRNDGFLGFPTQLWILLQLQSKKTKNYALLLWLVHWGYISLESATLQAKIMKSKKVQEDEEEGGKKRKAEAHLASRLWSWPLQIYSGKMQCFFWTFFAYVPKAQEI